MRLCISTGDSMHKRKKNIEKAIRLDIKNQYYIIKRTITKMLIDKKTDEVVHYVLFGTNFCRINKHN